MSETVRDAVRDALADGDWRNAREIADVVGVSDSTVRENLRVLHYGRVVERRRIGNAHEYRLRGGTT